jgi:hypothetical protein
MAIKDTIRKLFVFVGVTVCLLAGNLSCAHFPDYAIKELKVVEVDVEDGTVILESPDKETAVLKVGDVIGKNNFTITEINPMIILLESPYDYNGRKQKKGIPVFEFIFEATPMTNVPLKKP